MHKKKAAATTLARTAAAALSGGPIDLVTQDSMKISKLSPEINTAVGSPVRKSWTAEQYSTD
jgi:hypothetical protein